MGRSPELAISDMVTAIDHCLEYLPWLEAKDRTQSRMAHDAILRNLTVLGEAIRSLPQDLVNEISIIPWPKMRAVRNLVVHEYFRIDGDVITETVERQLPAVLTHLLKIAYLRELEPTRKTGSARKFTDFVSEEDTWVYWSNLDYLTWAERGHGEQIAQRERARIMTLVEDELDWLIRTPWRIAYCPGNMRDPDSDYQTLNWAQADLGTTARYEQLWGLYHAKWKRENLAWTEQYARQREERDAGANSTASWWEEFYTKLEAKTLSEKNSETPSKPSDLRCTT